MTARAAPGIATELAKSVPLTTHGGIDWWQVLQNWAAAIAILLIGWWLAKWIARVIRRINTRARMDATLNGFLSNLAYALALMIVGIEDTMTPAEDGLAAYERALHPKKLITIPGTHYAVYGDQYETTSTAARDWFVENL